jgi:hypothetical protein
LNLNIQAAEQTYPQLPGRQKMDIRFEKREHLQEKPDQKNLGFGKHFTDYMFVMDWDKEQGWHAESLVGFNERTPYD